MMKRAMMTAMLSVCCIEATSADDLAWLDAYNVVWTSQSKNSGESMPVSGGDIGLNVWVENDELLFYMGRAGYRDENGALLKPGRVRVKLTPNPFENGKFRQELKLREGYVSVNGEFARWHSAGDQGLGRGLSADCPPGHQVGQPRHGRGDLRIMAHRDDRTVRRREQALSPRHVHDQLRRLSGKGLSLQGRDPRRRQARPFPSPSGQLQRQLRLPGQAAGPGAGSRPTGQSPGRILSGAARLSATTFPWRAKQAASMRNARFVAGSMSARLRPSRTVFASVCTSIRSSGRMPGTRRCRN